MSQSQYYRNNQKDKVDKSFSQVLFCISNQLILIQNIYLGITNCSKIFKFINNYLLHFWITIIHYYWNKKIIPIELTFFSSFII